MNNLSYKEISIREDVSGCLLCYEAPCTKACPNHLEVDSIIRSLRLENRAGAVNKLPNLVPCDACDAKSCKEACLKGRINNPVKIDRIMSAISNQPKVKEEEVDLSIEFCGVKCENPFFLSSSVVGSNYEMVAKAFEMGWSGVAFKTIGMFVPNEVSPRFTALTKENVPFVGFKNIEQISDYTLEENIAFLKKLKKNYPTKIIVASIMGQNEEEWTKLAELMTEAGADIIECNFSCPHMTKKGVGSDVGQNPDLVSLYTKATRKGTYLPILAKMTPNIGNMEVPAIAAMKSGATGIAAINTIKSIMNVNLSTFASEPNVVGKTSIGGYSGKAVKPIALRFIHDMKTCEDLKGVEISGMGGIETWRDAVEFMALGCENLQITTSVMQYGYRIIEDLIGGMKLYLSSQGLKNVREIVGKALPNIVPADKLERCSICYPRFDREKCVGCGRCYLSCYDGGHQAIKMNEDTNKPILIVDKCVGCQLCVTVCPAEAISSGKRVNKK
ncbi:NAD-dependent dihydropyrimidine dehydrogenase subunit PreA [Clostridium sp. 'White wine YQ']|uniref:NAD-dependent dihydropyrimidine dehydrogenase subunit PreA n=1 Tax=Clostridium sp. 'White wine YQ' TaxID=3027474 RepID=UPI0023672676|nr:NAD-dependent dihydropyrimidine dehydrogenase subunit PreA [Clostridium sp. 'White wine YQ']MDD7794305.1 NAD-dependent dihydropyrimidine dehydrogenase subunit PreA [Clostridium sp. 'White wine YQ']